MLCVAHMNHSVGSVGLVFALDIQNSEGFSSNLANTSAVVVVFFT